LLLEALVPAFVAVAESFGNIEDARPLGPEWDAVATAGEMRVREFSTGRHLARVAIRKLGLTPAPLKRLQDGSPDWPAGLRGSITHCEGYRGAAVASAQRTAGIGIDAEVSAALPPEVLRLIATKDEIERTQDLATSDPTVHWDTVLFSAKEACLKARLSQDRGQGLSLDKIQVSLDGCGQFEMQHIGGLAPVACHGSYCSARGLIVCAVILPRSP
jgi:4'-phosphopantetheinyl transferase EntD